MTSNYSPVPISEERAVCQHQEQKTFDMDPNARLSATIDEIGARLSYISTALTNLYRKLYSGGEYEENLGFHPEVENSIAASVAETYRILAECEGKLDSIFAHL